MSNCEHDFDSNEHSEYCAKGCGEKWSIYEIKRLRAQLAEAREVIGFYGADDKWKKIKKVVDPSKDVIFASRYNEEKGQSEAVDLREPFESVSLEVTGRLKIDQGKRARAYLEKYPNPSETPKG